MSAAAQNSATRSSAVRCFATVAGDTRRDRGSAGLEHLAKGDPAAMPVIQGVSGGLRDGHLTFLVTAGRRLREYLIGSILRSQFKEGRELEFNTLRNND